MVILGQRLTRSEKALEVATESTARENLAFQKLKIRMDKASRANHTLGLGLNRLESRALERGIALGCAEQEIIMLRAQLEKHGIVPEELPEESEIREENIVHGLEGSENESSLKEGGEDEEEDDDDGPPPPDDDDDLDA